MHSCHSFPAGSRQASGVPHICETSLLSLGDRNTVLGNLNTHNDDVIMTTMASQITSLAVVYSSVYSDADQRKHQSSASLAFVWGIHRDRWIPRTKDQLRGKCFHLMTSSWIVIIMSTRSSLPTMEVVMAITVIFECICPLLTQRHKNDEFGNLFHGWQDLCLWPIDYFLEFLSIMVVID